MPLPKAEEVEEVDDRILVSVVNFVRLDGWLGMGCRPIGGWELLVAKCYCFSLDFVTTTTTSNNAAVTTPQKDHRERTMTAAVHHRK